jgi:hypothetical protein
MVVNNEIRRGRWQIITLATAFLVIACDENEPKMVSRSGQTGFELYPGEETYIIKSVGDVSMFDPTACEINDPNDPWIHNSAGAGRMYSMQHRPSDGAVGDPEQVEVGEGTMCFQFPNFNFAPFESIKSRGNLSINDFTVRFEGRCVVTNRDMPVADIHQMSCALPLVGPLPEGYAGGLMTTNSVLNAGGVPGYSSGSVVTLHMYKQ